MVGFLAQHPDLFPIDSHQNIHPFKTSKMKTTLIIPEQVGSKEHLQTALLPYKHLEPFPRHFVRFKIFMDPMFPRLADFVRPGWKVIDVGCGYGIAAVWLLAIYLELKFLAREPDQARPPVATQVLPCAAMDLLLKNEKADAVLYLDVLHLIFQTGSLENSWVGFGRYFYRRGN